MDLNALIKDFFYCRNIQEYVNRRFNHPDKVVLITKYYDHVVTKKGDRFYCTKDVECVGECEDEYYADDIDKDTVVIDLGANVGGFSIPAARKARRVIAYEPVRYQELLDNRNLNNTRNLAIFPVALGDGNPTTINWRGLTKVVETVKFRDILGNASTWEGSKLFLKCDVEGAEKYINPKDLSKFDRIEMELHYDFDVCRNIVKELEKTHFVSLTNVNAYGIYGIMHARRK